MKASMFIIFALLIATNAGAEEISETCAEKSKHMVKSFALGEDQQNSLELLIDSKDRLQLLSAMKLTTDNFKFRQPSQERKTVYAEMALQVASKCPSLVWDSEFQEFFANTSEIIPSLPTAYPMKQAAAPVAAP